MELIIAHCQERITRFKIEEFDDMLDKDDGTPAFCSHLTDTNCFLALRYERRFFYFANDM